MKSLNLKTLKRQKVSFYLALEQYLLSHFEEDVFFLWDIPISIVIGRNQLISSEVNEAYVKAHQVAIYRRPSGGGAIYADTGCFMYSFVTKEKEKEQVYKQYLHTFMDLMKGIGIDVYFSGRNDLMLDGKKFSGTAFYQTKHGSVLHGTFLYNTNLTHLVKALSVDPQKVISKGVKSVRERVINTKPYVQMTKRQLMDYFLSHVGTSEITLTAKQVAEVFELEKKFLDQDWIVGMNPKYTFQHKKRFPFGMLDIYVLVKNNRIIDMAIKGDFFEKASVMDYVTHFLHQPFTKDGVNAVLTIHPIDHIIEGCTNENVLDLLFEGEKK